MRILLLATAYNGLTQRAHIELNERGHDVRLALALSDDFIRDAVVEHEPDIIICPFLKQKVPADVWKNHCCIIIHPGIKGDRGASSLDWAIMDNAEIWGVTALEAHEEMDAGDIWATATFKMRRASKASIYRNEVTSAAISVILQTVERFASGDFTPEPLDYSRADVHGRLRPTMRQSDRQIDWQQDDTETVVRKINAADSSPGVLDHFCGGAFYLYGVHVESSLTGEPGEILATRNGAICRATIDGAVWISHLRQQKTGNRRFLKLPATQVLGDQLDQGRIPALDLPPLYSGCQETFKEIWYESRNGVGYLYFDFYNGAMNADQCRRLKNAVEIAQREPIKVLTLMGSGDFWSNGIHLNVIEAADNAANESWENINAIDDLVATIINNRRQMTIAAIRGNAGAGGVIQALAADHVLISDTVVLNPHYKSMGLYGSEYWTYLLPRRVGKRQAQELTNACLPVGATLAKSIGLADRIIETGTGGDDLARIRAFAEGLAQDPDFDKKLADKLANRERDENQKPLAAYRAEELARMSNNFYGTDRSYHDLRERFVWKVSSASMASHLLDYNDRQQTRALSQRIIQAA